MFLFGLNTWFRTNIHKLYELTYLRLAFIAVNTENVFFQAFTGSLYEFPAGSTSIILTQQRVDPQERQTEKKTLVMQTDRPCSLSVPELHPHNRPLLARSRRG